MVETHPFYIGRRRHNKKLWKSCMISQDRLYGKIAYGFYLGDVTD